MFFSKGENDMMYEKPEMEVLRFDKDVRALDIIGGPSQGVEDSNDASNGW